MKGESLGICWGTENDSPLPVVRKHWSPIWEESSPLESVTPIHSLYPLSLHASLWVWEEVTARERIGGKRACGTTHYLPYLP